MITLTVASGGTRRALSVDPIYPRVRSDLDLVWPTKKGSESSLRGFVAAIGILLVVIGGVFLIAPLSIDTPEFGKVGCESAIGEDPDDESEGEESTYRNFEMPRVMRNWYVTLKSRCEDAASDRHMWVIPLMGVGLVAAIGAAVVRPQRKD